MKRYIAAVSFAAFAVPAFAAGLPYEQTELDRALPNLEPQRTRFAAAAGSTRSDAGTGIEATPEATWDDDHNFIAPAQ